MADGPLHFRLRPDSWPVRESAPAALGRESRAFGLRNDDGAVILASRDGAGLGAAREGEAEGGALAEGALDLDAPPQPLDQVLDDGQAQAGAPALAGAGGVHPVEAL